MNDAKYTPGYTNEQALVAVFSDRETAREAEKRLHHEGFGKTWIGVARPNRPLTVNEESVPAKIGRFLGGELDGRTLTDTLSRHGIPEDEARRIENVLQPNDVILTLEAGEDMERAAQLAEACGGNVLARRSGGTLPTVSEDVFETSYDEDEDADRSGIGSRDTPGTRSAGGAISTQRHEDDNP